MVRISEAKAKEQIDSWLSYKRVRKSKIEDAEDAIDILIEAISEGDLMYVEKDGKAPFLEHKLIFPIEAEDGKVVVDKLVYKSRVQVYEINSKLQKVKNNDTHGMIAGYASAITGVNTGIIKKLDTEDYKIAQSISVFFM